MIDKNVIETRSAYIQQLDNGIIRLEKKLGVDLQLEDLEEYAKVYESILKGGKGLFLIVFEIDCMSDEDFRVRVSDKSRSKYKLAEAIIIKSLANRIEANFYRDNYEHHHPFKIFDSEQEGVKWLLSFK